MDRLRIESLKLACNIGIVQCVRENKSRNTQPLTFCTDIKYAVLRPYIFGICEQIRDRHAEITIITQILVNINGTYPFVSGYIENPVIRKKAVGICRGHAGKTASLIQNRVGHIRLIRKQLISPHYIDPVRTEYPYLAASAGKGIVSDDIKIIGIRKMMQRRYLPVSHISDGASRNDPEQVLFDKHVRYLIIQISFFIDLVSDEASMRAMTDAGIEKVMWITQQDERVCLDCDEKQGKIYKLSEVPDKPHPRCRCYLRPVLN